MRGFTAVRLALAAGLATPAISAPTATVEVAASEPDSLKPGEFIWDGAASGAGDIAVTVDLGRQIAWVYRGETLIAVSTVSSGREGYETPTGSFTILQKNVMHRSNLYDDAPMPFMQRLTWDGIALHAGRLPGRPASHGCIRLPAAFAKQLFTATRLGATVTVIDSATERGVEAAPVVTTSAATPQSSASVAEPLMAQPISYVVGPR